MGDSPRSDRSLNGNIRLTKNRERILELHKRLHNKQTQEALLDTEFQPVQESQHHAKPTRIRRADVKKYLGEPLPLPYLTSPRDIEKKNEEKTLNNSQNKTSHQRNTINRLKYPLGQNLSHDADTDIYKEKLRKSLKTFQRDQAEKKLVDRVVQTDDILNEPHTPKSFRFPTSSGDMSPKSYNNTADGMKLENSFEKDMLLNGFKLRDSSFTPDNFPKPLTKLKPPLEVTSDYVHGPSSRKSNNRKEIHLNCRSILGSPITLFILIMILYIYFQKFIF
ncbi:hypothetical protein BN7_6313 [Wickerhamomyces ciferrii]|uniref:Uncharacterized protein n=1 Tax=Wickerhamomyces ciferrii (strain ATCC 14091 / BCRC 22168 / CBS 111 / JCM 3599 / NBRC 0793 / NRRL Y-1031 F-60-10) TaxID=1206466 RepID=K0KU60_WICCF|nr:uncharacterized protein BN7_6313 [Wickerhamomyces ciferrii]CCH46716.1 hypothetical protein BN7_6313 [Wickerhamomyces ciferrii]